MKYLQSDIMSYNACYQGNTAVEKEYDKHSYGLCNTSFMAFRLHDYNWP